MIKLELAKMSAKQGLDLIEPAADMGGGFFGFYLLLKLILVNES